MTQPFVIEFSEISMSDIPLVGGKNASLGELYSGLKVAGVNALGGFAVTTAGYDALLSQGGLRRKLTKIFETINVKDVVSLSFWSDHARNAVLNTPLPQDLSDAITSAYVRLCEEYGEEIGVAVRSSATAEDLTGTSFAGQHSSFLNVHGVDDLLQAVHECFASLFTDRAIDYRSRNGFDHMKVALSVGVQPMVRSDLASSGVMFTLDPETGFSDVVVIEGSYGLGEMVVKGVVNPDSWTIFKPTLLKGAKSIIDRRVGSKEFKLVFKPSGKGTMQVAVPKKERNFVCLTDDDVLTLSKWACRIEEYYSKISGCRQAMDIEWAKDGISGELFILQARPETIHSPKKALTSDIYHLSRSSERPIVTGRAVGEQIGCGKVRVVLRPTDLEKVEHGDVLVAISTDPDWEPVMKRVSAIITDQGGRTSHAAIVSREVGVPCVVGTGSATKILRNLKEVTVSCAEGSEGRVYEGRVPFTVEKLRIQENTNTQTKVMLNVADPSRALSFAQLPNDGVGLARIEFIINNRIGIHPMAIRRFPDLQSKVAVRRIAKRLAGEDPCEYFVNRLSEGIGMIAAAFYPKPVIVRTSDFKTNEYAKLLGGEEFEPLEENPMLGFRGASRYYDDRYSDGFELECRALRKVREEFGLTNVKVMIPFCRTVDEAKKVIGIMAKNGLKQGEKGLEIYAMCELPSNVLDADRFLEVFDGYSIGSNDLTQLILGLDRDSGTVSGLFDERDAAVKVMVTGAIAAAKRNGKPIGICGQAPSDYPDFAEWLVEQGITSISLNPDSIVKTMDVIARAERKSPLTSARA